jgi:hypothetical protein
MSCGKWYDIQKLKTLSTAETEEFFFDYSKLIETIEYHSHWIDQNKNHCN